MIEVVQAKNGSPVLVKNGKYLASSFDPQKEAETWWSTCHRLAKKCEQVFILGLGSGYHVEVALRELPHASITVIECDANVVAKNANKFRQGNLKIIHESDWRKLYQNPSIADKVQSSYAVLSHPPSLSVECDFFGNAYKFLLARNVEGLFALLKLRPELLAELDESKLELLARSGDPVSIKTLVKLMKNSTYANPNRRLWKVLEELVA